MIFTWKSKGWGRTQQGRLSQVAYHTPWPSVFGEYLGFGDNVDINQLLFYCELNGKILFVDTVKLVLAYQL